jgi:N-acylneuraminate cytidylyltransferase
MIAHILQAARESGLFDLIHVSTESLHIRQVVENLGFIVDFMRPDELADDHTPIMPVLRYVSETYESRGQIFDQVWLLMACAPLVKQSDLMQASELFDQFGGVNPVLAIAEYPVPIEWAFNRTLVGKLNPVYPGMFAVRSQDIEKKYFDAGLFTVFSARRVQASDGAGSDEGFVGYIIPKGTAIDIDDETDWALAEAMYRARY